MNSWLKFRALTRVGLPHSTPLLPALLLLVLSASGCATSEQPVGRSDFAARRQNIKTVAIVQPDVKIIKKVVGNPEQPLTEDDARVATELMTLLSHEFSDRSFKVQVANLDSESHDRTQSAYDQISYGQLNDAQHPTLTVPKNVGGATDIARSNKVDAVVFTAFQGVTRSHGSVAAEVATDVVVAVATMGIIVPAKSPNGADQLLVVLVDGADGNVLWQNQSTETWPVEVPTFEDKDIAPMMTAVFEKFPP